MLTSLYVNASLPAFLVRSRLLKLITVTQLSLVQLLQNMIHMYKTVKTYMFKFVTIKQF